MKKDNSITSYGLFTTLVVTVVGIGIFSYPRDLASTAGSDSWILTLAAGFIYLLIAKLILKSIEVNNYKKVTEAFRDNFGRMIGGIILLIAALLNIFAVSIAMRVFVEVIKMYLLEKTPTEFLIIVTILAGIYLVRAGIGGVIKFNEISFWIMFIPMFLVLAFTLKIADFSNLLPVLHKSPMSYLNAFKYTFFCFGGMEILFLLYPLLKNKKKSFNITFKAVLFITIFYTLVVMLCIAVFTTKETQKLLWPTITMIRSIDIPGSIVERWDGIILALWILFYFTTFTNGFSFSAHLLSDGIALKDIKIATAVLVPFIYIIAMYANNIAEVYQMASIIMPIAVICNMILLPVLLIITGKIKHVSKRG